MEDKKEMWKKVRERCLRECDLCDVEEMNILLRDFNEVSYAFIYGNLIKEIDELRKELNELKKSNCVSPKEKGIMSNQAFEPFGFVEEIGKLYFIDMTFTEKGVKITFEHGEHKEPTLKMLLEWPPGMEKTIQERCLKMRTAMEALGEL